MADSPTPADRTAASAPGRHHWGLGEATLAWVASIFIGSTAYLGLLAVGNYSVFTAERPGGHLGRTVAQLTNGEALRNDAVPLLWQMLLLIPGWIALIGVSWLAAGALQRVRTGWSLRGEISDVPAGIGVGLFLQIPMMVIVGIVMQAVLGDFEPSGRALALVDGIAGPLDVIVLVLAVAVGAPIVEELFYRGIVQASLVRRFGPIIGIGVASLVFGAVHLSLIELAPLTVAGLGFGIIAWRSGRLLPAVIAHMTFNSFTLVVLFVSTSGA
ncbi:MAG: membrane protease YdiL (CAAX protease family) [Verrucomicrobiales bacterium]